MVAHEKRLFSAQVSSLMVQWRITGLLPLVLLVTNKVKLLGVTVTYELH